MQLCILSNNNVVKKFHLESYNKQIITVGGNNNCDIFLGEIGVPDLYCNIIHDGYSWKIQDTQGNIGVFFNSERIYEKQIIPGEVFDVYSYYGLLFEISFQEDSVPLNEEKLKNKNNRKKVAIVVGVICVSILIITLAAIIALHRSKNNKDSVNDVQWAHDEEWDYDYHYERDDEDLGDVGYAQVQGECDNTDSTIENTVMIYLVGSNLESEAGAASQDILEMYSSGVDFNKTNVVFFTGGCRDWQLDISSDYNGVYRLVDGGFVEDGCTDSLLNMGQADTLLCFLSYCKENYPAQHYILIMWDHGGGPVLGYGADEMFDNDSLTFDEISLALKNSGFTGDNKLDIIGFDACLMGSYEYALLFKDYAKIYVASQEVEPGCGWDYSFLKKLNNTSDPEEIAHEIIDSYADYCEKASQYGNVQYTLSAVDLMKIEDTVQYTDVFFKELNDSLEIGHYSEIIQNRENAFCYGVSAYGKKGDSIDSVDFGSLCNEFYGTNPRIASELNDCINDIVLYQRTNISEASGVSIYFPFDNQDFFDYYGQTAIDKTILPENYVVFMRNFSDAWDDEQYNSSYVFGQQDDVVSYSKDDQDGNYIQKSIDSSIYPKLEKNKDKLTVSLSDEQVNNLSGAYYSILQKTYNEEVDSYIPVMSNVYVEPDSEGNINIDYDTDIITVQTKDGNGYFYCSQINHSKDSEIYSSRISLSEVSIMEASTSDSFYYYLNIREKDGKIILDSIVSEDEEEKQIGKNSVDLNAFRYIESFKSALIPTYNEYGQLNDIDDWEKDYISGYYSLKYEDELVFKKTKLSDEDSEFYCMVTLVDTQGKIYNTSIVPLGDKKSFDIIEYDTENGYLRCLKDDEGVHITEYEGKDDEIIIPDYIDNVHVVEIDNNAFERNTYLKIISIPETVTRIGDNAFSHCSSLNQVILNEGLIEIGAGCFASCDSLEKIAIPTSVKRIGTAAFSKYFYNSDDVTLVIPAETEYIGNIVASGGFKIEVEPENKNYKIVDESLLTYDGKTLVQYLGNEVEYTIPEGVEIIDSYAFSYGIEKVIFPETLVEIRPYAFDMCMLEEIILPDSCEKLDSCCFAFNGGGVGKLVIGKNLNHISTDAFRATPVGEFDVSPDNKNYKIVDGFLLSYDGEQIILVSSELKGDVYVPDGVVTVSVEYSFNNDEIERIILPDSVKYFDSCSVYGRLNELYIGSGLVCWKNKNSIQGLKRVSISDENEHFASVDGVVYSKDKKKLLAVPSEWDGGDVLTIEDGTKSIMIDGDTISTNKTVKKIVVPDSVNDIWGNKQKDTFFNMFECLEEIEVSDNNEKFSSKEGLLYSKDGTRLYAVPCKVGSVINISEGTTVVKRGAFTNGIYYMNQEPDLVKEIYFPDGLKEIEDLNYDYVDKELIIHIPDSVTYISTKSFNNPQGGDYLAIYGKKGSYAEYIANKRGIKFVEE